ncbi:MAG: F0F1-type ATP synthase, alpha subunit [Parcubacteria group bacterium GW2011_GWA1_44_13]|uniref:ATP synthase subunit alpha n=1 Tax=Candidatus Nomurabacteria bacterium GW2011_GWB1_44_12 TaxID=1618748 RepID=A0A837I7G3_9BACT|nr:MAG: F0F1-type ATP synthase, alpha subunit [Candidatus Nomurabacteria bacterium GW2011_GWB1_44_12]KKT38094.1 MAG: F0F1-type ATP synthase, alpha subunit [Parcubacteria group bacterium GW2011_GWA1_44_13]KKT59710.1 MAG: F0F1-type ATP synthase, alpha subunit [Parcubacteria group bacterium GW2011_GWC1_44_26]
MTMNTILIEKIRKEIEALEPKTSVERVGTVVKAGDGIAEIDGLQNAMMAEMVVFEPAGKKALKDTLDSEPIVGFVLNLEEDYVKAVILSGAERVVEGMVVKGTGKTLSIPVSTGMIGRVVNALGEPVDGKGAIKEEGRMPIERIAFGVIDRAGVDTPVHTGIKAIDSMIPVGRGQRELIIGDRGTGKTAIALDTILNQITEPKETRPICIYVAIGQKESKIARIVGELEERGAMAYTIVVVAGASEAAALQYLAPFTGATIGEFFMLKGKDAVAVYDDLSKHAVAYRQMSLLLRRPPGREAYPGDIFYLHSRLLERAAKLSDKLGGGSLTALPIIETQQGDVSAYIPTNVISITDGQIYLDTDLFNKGMRPAVNVGLSVSRVGSNAQTKAMKKVAGKIRLELAQFRELEAFMQFASDLDKETKDRIEKGRRLSELLKQTNGKPLSFEKEVIVIFAGISGIIDKVKVEDMRLFEDKLSEYFDHHAKGIVEAIRKDRAIAEQTEANLKLALADFVTSHPELFIVH